jgi:hypothetical protein
MNSAHSELLPRDFASGSRVWIYQGARAFTTPEALTIKTMLEDFVKDWKSHGVPVKGYAHLFYSQFIVLMADESDESGATDVSGCSTDSSVRLIKAIEQRFGISLFDRLMLAFWIGEEVRLVPLSQLPQTLENGDLGNDTLYFNNTVQTKAELETKWLIPVKDSWLAARYPKNFFKSGGNHLDLPPVSKTGRVPGR